MKWNYRIVEYHDGGPYGLHEVYWEGDKPVSRTVNAVFVRDTREEIMEDLRLMCKDAQKEVVKDKQIGEE